MRPARFLSSLLSFAARRWPDLLALGIGVAALVTSCYRRGSALPMWLDEFVSWNLIQDASFGHMLRALGDQADGVPPLYFILARGWATMFSTDEFPLRLFTTAAMAVALGLTWGMLRRVYGLWPTIVGVSLVIGTSETIRFENSNIRFYGLFLALIALVAGLAVEIGVRERPGWRLLALNTLAQALLVFCQYIGGFYSAALLMGTFIGDVRVYRRVRWRVLLSYPAGWLVLGLWIPQLFRQAAINHPHSWVPVPDWADLTIVNIQVGGEFLRLSAFLALVCVAALFDRQASLAVNPTARTADSRQGRLLLVGGTLLSLVPFLWIFSQLAPTNSLFLARYLLGASLGWMILLVQLVSMVFKRFEGQQPWLRLGIKGLTIAFALWNLVALCDDRQASRLGQLGVADVAYGHPELPMVCQRAKDYFARAHYSPQADRYYFLQDWEAVNAPNNRYPGAPVEYKMVSASGRNYGELYPHVVDAGEFLRAHPAFLIQADPNITWITNRLKPEEYRITIPKPEGPMASFVYIDYPVLLVERRQPRLAARGETLTPTMENTR